jgi:hypothetical protein
MEKLISEIKEARQARAKAFSSGAWGVTINPLRYHFKVPVGHLSGDEINKIMEKFYKSFPPVI